MKNKDLICYRSLVINVRRVRHVGRWRIIRSILLGLPFFLFEPVGLGELRSFWWFFWIFPQGVGLRRVSFIGPQVCEGDVACLDLLSRFPSHEMWIADYLHALSFLYSLGLFCISGSDASGYWSCVFKLEAAIALMVVLMEKYDGFGSGIVDADLLCCLHNPSGTS